MYVEYAVLLVISKISVRIKIKTDFCLSLVIFTVHKNPHFLFTLAQIIVYKLSLD